jgi:hypothetical protein
MGMGQFEFLGLGAITYAGPTASSRECDSSYINMVLRGNNGWPNLVIEAGVSESMPRLRQDKNWWFCHSYGAVKLVILIKVNKQRREIIIETQCMRKDNKSQVSYWLYTAKIMGSHQC